MTLDDVLGFQLLQVRGVTLTVGTLLTALMIVIVGWLVSSAIQRMARRTLAKRSADDNRNLHAVLRLGHYAIMFVASVLAFETLGINLTTLFAAGAIFAIGLGFAMQNVVQNFVSGVILLVERTIRPGDILEMGGEVVQVKELGLRSTLVRTRYERGNDRPEFAARRGDYQELHAP